MGVVFVHETEKAEKAEGGGGNKKGKRVTFFSPFSTHPHHIHIHIQNPDHLYSWIPTLTLSQTFPSEMDVELVNVPGRGKRERKREKRKEVDSNH